MDMEVRTQSIYTTGLSARKGRFSQSSGEPNRAIEFQATYSEDELVNALKRMKELVKEPTVAPSPATINESTDHERKQGFNKKLADLSAEVRSECARSESLKQGVEKLGQEIGKLEREIKGGDSMKGLQEEVNRLRKEWDNIKPIKVASDLLSDLGLIAVYVEQAICCHVLPEIFVNEPCASLHDLLDYLNDSEEFFPLDPSEYDCEKILQEARVRWEIVCKSFDFPDEWKTKTGGWRVIDFSIPNDIRAIEFLKLNAVGINTRSVSLKYAEKNVGSVKDKVLLWQFKLIAAFIMSVKDKMTKSGIHHDNLLE